MLDTVNNKNGMQACPALIMLVGIPASGKSTVSRKYAARGFKVLSSDEVRMKMFSGELPCRAKDAEKCSLDGKALNSEVFSYILSETRAALLSGCSVMVDATNLIRKRRISFLSELKNIKAERICLLLVCSPDECKRRNRERNGMARVPDHAMENMLSMFECPTIAEGWDRIDVLMDEIPYSFPFSEAECFSQDNPHHTLSLLGHLRAARDYLIEKNAPDFLTRVAYYHDIGKLYSKTFVNKRGQITDIAHYYSHENYGAYLYLCEMLCGKGASAEDVESALRESLLINLHMRPLSAWQASRRAYERDRALFGDEMILLTELLHEADRAAH